jgi:phosphoglycolate phosphatase-like HAD superfamily hydrolase
MNKFVILDLDNTLYDWVTYYARSFYAMVDVLEIEIGAPREELLDTFKKIHNVARDSEVPFAYKSVIAKFTNDARRAVVVAKAADALASAAQCQLALYPGVIDTLEALTRSNVVFIGCTDAAAINAKRRLLALGVASYFRRIYAVNKPWMNDADHIELSRELADGSVRLLPNQLTKPNPDLLRYICRLEDVDPASMIYVGDSMVRDIPMALGAGAKAVWAKYGTLRDEELWKSLVRITHWAEADVVEEARLRNESSGVVPSYTIESFDQLGSIVRTLTLR